MIHFQTKMEGFHEDPEEEPKKAEPFGIPFPGKNVSTGQAVGRMEDETVPIWAKVRAIEKVAGFPTLNGVTKDELQGCLKWLFHHFDFDI